MRTFVFFVFLISLISKPALAQDDLKSLALPGYGVVLRAISNNLDGQYGWKEQEHLHRYSWSFGSYDSLDPGKLPVRFRESTTRFQDDNTLPNFLNVSDGYAKYFKSFLSRGKIYLFTQEDGVYKMKISTGNQTPQGPWREEWKEVAQGDSASNALITYLKKKGAGSFDVLKEITELPDELIENLVQDHKERAKKISTVKVKSLQEIALEAVVNNGLSTINAK